MMDYAGSLCHQVMFMVLLRGIGAAVQLFFWLRWYLQADAAQDLSLLYGHACLCPLVYQFIQ